MEAIDLAVDIAAIVGTLLLFMGGGLMLAIGWQAVLWWAANKHRPEPGDDELITGLTREEIARLVRDAGPEGVPTLVDGELCATLVWRETPDGPRIVPLWPCGVAGCRGHETTEGAGLHRQMGGFAADLESWARRETTHAD